MRYLSESLRIEILILIGQGDRSRTQAEVAGIFREKYPNLPPISQGTISKIESRFREHGHVRDLPRQRQPKINEDVKVNLLLAIQENPVTSARELARESDVSHKSVLKVIKSAKMHPYKMQMLHELTEDDPDRRIEFCEQMMHSLDNNHFSLDWIIFSDECTFSLNGSVNRKNCRYWAENNPHWMRETHSQFPGKLNVWAGIVGDRVIGPIFFEENLTGERYLRFLQEDLTPSLAAIFPNAEDNAIFDDRLWFQQDGAPPHYAVVVRQYLDEAFPQRWIGRRGPIEWPARSPDLNPLDFFLWGYLKSKVYVTKPHDLEDLKAKLRHEIRQITPQMLHNVKNGFYHRLGLCQDKNGAHFEHFLH